MKISRQTRLYTALGLVYILWGSTYLGMKIAEEVLPPFLLSVMRFVFAGSIMLAVGFWQEKEWPTLKQWRNAALIGVLLIGIGNSMVGLGVHYMPSGLVALVVAALPAWIIALDWAFFSRKQPKTLTLCGLALGFVGLFIIFNPFRQGHYDFPLWPIPLLMFGSICWAFGSLLSPRLDNPKPLTASGIQMLAGMMTTLMISLLTESDHLQKLGEMEPRNWAAVAYLVVFGSLIGYTAYSWLVNNAPPQLTATYAYVNPVVAILLGWLILHERLSVSAIMGSAVVIAGVVLMTLKKRA